MASLALLLFDYFLVNKYSVLSEGSDIFVAGSEKTGSFCKRA